MDRNIQKFASVLFMILVNTGLFSQVLGNNNRLGIIVNNTILNKPIVVINQMDNYILYSDKNAYNLCLYNKNNEIHKEIKIGEINIFSAKLIKYMNIIVVEVIGYTNMGNGSLYLFDTDLNLLLERFYVDTHMEMWEYYDFRKMELFMNREYIQGENISEVFRDGNLNIDYNYNGENIIRIYGTKDYISEINGKQEIIISEEINENYTYSRENNKFELMQNRN